MRLYYLFLLILLKSIALNAQETEDRDRLIVVLSIDIEGNKITKKDILLRELEFSKGDVVNKKDLFYKGQKSEENLKNLQLFNFIEINFSFVEVDGYKKEFDRGVKIHIKIVERWYIWPYPILEVSGRNFNVWWEEFKSSDYSDFSRLNYGMFLNWENFRGNNELLQLKFRKGFKEHYVLRYNKPYINYKKTIGVEGLIHLFRRKKSFYKTENNTLLYIEEDGFTTKDLEIRLKLNYKKGTRESHSLAMHYLHTKTTDEILLRNPEYLSNNCVEGDYFKVTYQYINEQRDYNEYPLHGYYLDIEANKFIEKTSPVKHFEIISRVEKYIEPFQNLFLGSSLKGKWATNDFQPYFSQKALGFEDYLRGYEYYVIDGQQYWISKTILKYVLIENRKFDISFVKMKQFKKSHYSIYFSIFSDIGYVRDSQNGIENSLSNSFLWGKGVSLDYVTYYDKVLRIEYSMNHLGEKGIFLHFSNPFGVNKK